MNRRRKRNAEEEKEKGIFKKRRNDCYVMA
jgi:hypothetical protein